MKMSRQDKYYLDIEADAFFERNKYDFELLPEKKKDLLKYFENILVHKKINNILEIGCHIGDLLNYSVDVTNASRGYGIEPSSAAVEIGNTKFSKKCHLMRGTAADNDIFANLPICELILVNDVFCWISRETLFHSIANIDDSLSTNGYLIIRDFLPDKRVRNRNRHVVDNDIFCHKVPGSHASIFLQSGNYQIIQSRIFTDKNNELSRTKEYDYTENRWIDILLKKGWD